ncbi:chemotaxis protein CheR [Psychrosphaera saromensis]|uniref:protein-glutamate O-methyltransferase n=1 Tax=Psychrosphaera saromensis TaxID=716813 RepID=A0A2S7UYP6_9GAMM|nr:protein-glutamate O-methyltransferase CheR [Psychrosphaera saromensis]PQJ54858.1 chemotaxis protein CheR [Psychrosphaera saromensis]GHB56584.1 chemotaxis protein CheR [Psychrosphaera saromensis]GLQ13900.1 chemotaxis protein CheR [Psychrosphaera saromensis]
MSNKTLSDNDYGVFCDFLEQQCGIVLGTNKQYLVKSRLSPLMARFEIETITDLVNKTMRQSERQLRAAVIDAMTTNETLWFRDVYPYELLKNKLLPELDKGKPLKIWSAASSSGQEPYSIAMTIQEYKNQVSVNSRSMFSIVGTDISNTMLDICKNGEYDALALSRGLSADRKSKFFADSGHGMMQINADVKRMVNFRHLNLLDNYHLLGKFDIIFCRNVLIYFSADIKSQIINKFAEQLNPNGYLVLGASESMSGLSDAFNMIRCNPGIVYQKK